MEASSLEAYEEEDLEKLTVMDMEDMDIRSSPEMYEEEDLEKQTLADMKSMDRHSFPKTYEEEDLEKLMVTDMEDMDIRSSLETYEEEDLEKLTVTDMEHMNARSSAEVYSKEKAEGPELKEISGNNSMYDEPKLPSSLQGSDTSRECRSGNWQESNLMLARKIIKKYRLKRMSKGECGLSYHNGRSYEPLIREVLETMVYDEIPFEVKIGLDSCSAIKRNVIEYIYDEIALMVREENREYYFDNSDYERIRGKVVLKNGVYNIVNDMLEAFDTDSPYYYELDASYLECDGKWLETPTFDKVISDACEGDKESIKTILQGIGALLIPDKLKTIIVLGPASNSGKSVIGGLLEKIIPRSRILHISPAALRGRFALGNAENAVLISCMDVDMEDISPAAAGCIKRATGDNVISAERKHQDVKNIYVRFKFVFGTNGGFCTSQYDPGWVNRLFVLPFVHELSEEEIDMRVPEKLEAEKDAIVTKLLRSMREVLKSDGSIRLYESPASKALKLKWTMQNNYFEDFFREIVELTGDDLDNYSSEEVYDVYSRFFICRARQDRESGNRHKLSKTEITDNLRKYGGGLVEKKRMLQNRKEHFKNAQHRLCGFLLKSADIFDNADRNGNET